MQKLDEEQNKARRRVARVKALSPVNAPCPPSLPEDVLGQEQEDSSAK